MNFLVKLLKYICVFIILILSYNLLLNLVSLFPSSIIYANCLKSAIRLDKEKGFYFVVPPYFVDNWTDSLIINEAYSIDNSSPTESYLKVRKNYCPATIYELPDMIGELSTYSENKFDENNMPVPDTDYNIIKELYNTLNNNSYISPSYTRYYHGYLVLFRPLLIFFDIIGIRTLLFICFIILFIIFAIKMYKTLGKQYMFAFCISLIAFDFFATSYSLQQSLVLVITIVTSIIILSHYQKLPWDKMTLLLFVVGSITNYFDFLTAPTLTLALPLLIYVLCKTKEEKYSNKELFLNVIKVCIMWSIGYAFTWISKWVICNLLIDSQTLKSAIEQINYRSVGEIANHSRIILMLEHCFVLIDWHIIIAFILEFIYRKKHKRNNVAPFNINNKLVLAFVCTIPIFWSIITKNHFYYHIYFTYKNLIGLSILFFLLFIEAEERVKSLK